MIYGESSARGAARRRAVPCRAAAVLSRVLDTRFLRRGAARDRLYLRTVFRCHGSGRYDDRE